MNKSISWNQASQTDLQVFEPEEVFNAGQKHHSITNTAWPIAHRKTMKNYKVKKKDIQEYVINAWKNVEELSLYAHIPFCEKICKFCDYSVVQPEIKNEKEEDYFIALSKEIEMYKDKIGTQTKRLVGFDIGGGTPSSVESKYIGNIIEQVRNSFIFKQTMNMSIETTPKIAAEEPQKVSDYYDMGIRRISMGVQSISTKMIGRESTSMSWNKKASENIRKSGFEQFNVDLMYGFAKQTTQNVVASVEHVLSLNPEFVTLYRMRYKGTDLEQKAQGVNLDLVEEQYKAASTLLSENGYSLRPGKNTYSKLKGNDGLSDYLHNRVERAVPYLGVGLGAQSFNPKNTLSYNDGAMIKHTDPYINKINTGLLPIQDAHHLSIQGAMAKMIAVSFYSGGIHLESFKKTFNISLENAFPKAISYILKNNFMSYNDKYETLQLTKKGVENYSGVISLFYNGEVQSHLLNLEENGWMGGSNSVRPIHFKRK